MRVFDAVARGAGGEAAFGKRVYLLEATGDYDRADSVNGSSPAAVAAFIAGETLVDCYADAGATDPLTQPLRAGREGRFTADSGAHSDIRFAHVVDTTEIELYSPDDTDDPIVPWETSNIVNVTVDADLNGMTVRNVVAEGADPTGVVDSTAAIQAVLDDALTTGGGGVVYFPPGEYLTTDTLRLTYNTGVANTMRYRIMGTHWGNVFTGDIQGGSIIRYDGPDADPVIQADSGNGIEIDHMVFDPVNASYSGDVMDLAGHFGDTTLMYVHDCSFPGASGVKGRSCILLWATICSKIERCSFGGATQGIRFHDANYCVAIDIDNCLFHFHTDCDIFMGSPDGESISIHDCTHEASNVAIKGGLVSEGATSNNLQYSLRIYNNWYGDQSNDINWMQSLRTQGSSPCIISGNKFATPNGGNHITGLSGAWVIEGNSFAGGDSVLGNAGAASPVTLIGNINSVAADWWTTEPLDYNSLGNSFLPNYQNHEVNAFAQKANVTTADLSLADDAGWFIIAARNAPAVSTNGALWHDIDDSSSCIQGGTRLRFYTGGTAPTERMQMNSTGLSFHASTPIAKPTVTGSRGGNAALADLLTKLASYGLITDGSS